MRELQWLERAGECVVASRVLLQVVLSSIVFCSLIDPGFDCLKRAVGKKWTSLRHSISERRSRRELPHQNTCVRFSRNDCRTVVATPHQLRDSRDKQAAAATVTSIAPVALEYRRDLIGERDSLTLLQRRICRRRIRRHRGASDIGASRQHDGRQYYRCCKRKRKTRIVSPVCSHVHLFLVMIVQFSSAFQHNAASALLLPEGAPPVRPGASINRSILSLL